MTTIPTWMPTIPGVTPESLWLPLAMGAALALLFLGARALPRLAPGWIRKALGARPLARLESPALTAAARRMARAAGVNEPVLLVVPHPQTNVFVFAGPTGAPEVAFTEGALRTLDDAEVEAVVGAALARATHPAFVESTLAAGVGLASSHAAGLGLVSGVEVERSPLVWPVGLPFLLLGSVLSRGLAGPPPGAPADLRGGELSGRCLEIARLLEHMEFTAHAEPMAVSGALARLALVDHRGACAPFSLPGLFHAPPPSAPRTALLRGSSASPRGPSRARAA